MDYYALPDATGIKPRHFNALLWGLCGLTVLYVGQLSFSLTSSLIASAQEETEHPADSYRLGGHTLTVPEPYLKDTGFDFFEAKRTAGENLELAVVWPTMAPASRTRSKARSFGNGSNIVYVEISSAEPTEDLGDQIEPVYRRLATVPVMRGPAGLNVLTLSPGEGLAEDEIVYDTGHENRYAARCKRKAGTKLSICERSFRLNDELTITYQFEKPLLANWGRLERRAKELVEASLLPSEGSLAGMKKASPTG